MKPTIRVVNNRLDSYLFIFSSILFFVFVFIFIILGLNKEYNIIYDIYTSHKDMTEA